MNSQAQLRALGMTNQIYKGELGYTQGALAAGEPGYVKQGYANFDQGLIDSSRASSAADLSAAFGGRNAPQGGATLATIGRLSGAGAGNEALALSQGKLAEGQAMFGQTQNLLQAMTGQSLGGLSQAAGFAQQQAGAIAHMRNYNPTTANILGALSAAGSIYGAYQGAGAAGTTSFGGTGATPSMGGGG